jgi:hypothetical protein
LRFQVSEELIKIDRMLACLFILDWFFEIWIKIDFAVGEGDLILDVHLIELLAFGIEIVLLDQVIQLEGQFLDLALEGNELQLFLC